MYQTRLHVVVLAIGNGARSDLMVIFHWYSCNVTISIKHHVH